MALILVEIDQDGATEVAERLTERVRRSPVILEDGQKIPITASMGVATLPMHGTTSAALIASADKALYAAKHNGRNRVETA